MTPRQSHPRCHLCWNLAPLCTCDPTLPPVPLTEAQAIEYHARFHHPVRFEFDPFMPPDELLDFINVRMDVAMSDPFFRPPPAPRPYSPVSEAEQILYLADP